MSRWTFFGRVHPERIPLTWNTPLEGISHISVLNLDIKFRIIIHASQIIVDIEFEGDNPDVDSLRNVAADLVRTLTDLVGYLQGLPFEVEIVSANVHGTNEWKIFGTEIPALATSRRGQDHSIKVDLLSAVSTNAAAQMALADFRKAMRDPVGTGFYCYRAVEAMMQSMKANPKENDEAAWKNLRERLCVGRSVLNSIKQHADYPRHGRPSQITDFERATVFKLTDEVIRRFLTYLTHGKVGLSVQEFPLFR